MCQRLGRFCFCWPLRLGVICLAMVELLYCVFEILVLSYFTDEDSGYLALDDKPDLLERYKIVSDLVMIGAAITLLVGACRQSSLCLSPYLVADALYAVWSVVFVLLKIGSESLEISTEYAVAQVAFLCFHVYAWWVVDSYYAELTLPSATYDRF